MALSQAALTRKEEITTSFLQLMEEHIADLLSGRAEGRFSATEFARRLYIHPRHLTNTLRETTGRSPCDFMEQRILAEAQQMLRATELSIADIGYRFGYNDPTNFTKFFKGMAGITPLQYRKSQRETKI
ncbi:helix-turn-helix transcriptional regulator [Chitinophaga agrisoli]|uniref:Helix-turn-helix transcriptional regulator n=1 Tax=Chitinophaga agrisoli TaxID=2607653 RepID=A0A5B2VPZ5_9BACT|nr:AraC family transcriptional regulator [Chitinophaga agrisoli]KAA2240748.1 helix-turn-helix transcriptional regulator [Chitinophaga agrisoli]